MKPLFSFAAALTLAWPALSDAACVAPSTRLNTRAAVIGAVQGKTICVGSAPRFDAQEYHDALGALIDYKRGQPAPGNVDPTKQVGTWSITGTDTRGVLIRYDYGGGTVYSYQLWDNGGGSYSFCSANPEVKATIKSGQVPC